MHYRCLKEDGYREPPYEIVPIRHEDMLRIKQWRNEQISVLRQAQPISEEEQIRYYQTVVVPTFNQDSPPQLLFSFLKDKDCIGYGGLTHLNWKSQNAEISFLLKTQRNRNLEQYQKDFSVFLGFLKRIAFSELQLHRLYAETYDIRPAHIEVLEQNGFVLEGRLKEHAWVENRFVDSLIHGCLE